MKIDIPSIVAEIAANLDRYDRAIEINDLDALDEMFWRSDKTLRYAANGSLYGHAAISAFRRGRNIVSIERTRGRTVISAFGENFATADAEYSRPGFPGVSRQSQAWVRLPEGWRIVSAHVSDFTPTG
ncbi:MAG: oxalurate catabolism protein HpxZ [Burkholderiales bacterium]